MPSTHESVWSPKSRIVAIVVIVDGGGGIAVAVNDGRTERYDTDKKTRRTQYLAWMVKIKRKSDDSTLDTIEEYETSTL